MVRDTDGFDEFYTAEIRPLRRIAYLLTRDWSEAEELAQDAMERTFRAWSRIAERDRPQAYARTVLVNRHRSLLRRAMVEAKHVMVGRDETPSAAGLTDERLSLWNALATLPIRHRQAIVLRYYEDLSDGEIADILGCSAGTVRSLVHRGLKRLQEAGIARELETVGSGHA